MTDRAERRCPRCGGASVYKDASAVWSVAAQDWQLASVQDNECCADCGAEGDWLTHRPSLTNPIVTTTADGRPQVQL